ncbi:head GIN domain-containing protein [Catalinimonas sp. 4WD22]|uniref:head GIN domain-containing protein n=1 Tax=Catalinimonas locisalis TaxID=3133978 RepID=UPI0031010BD4
MKTKNIFYKTLPAFFLLVFTSGCYVDFDDDDFGPAIKGSGNIIIEERALSEFDRIILEGSMDLIILQDDEQLLEVEADDNIVPIISTSVRGGELKIKSTRSYRSRDDVKIYISVQDLEELKVRGSGDVYGESVFTGDRLNLEISGSGNMDMEIYYDRLFSEINGSGNFSLYGEALEQEVRINGSGDYRAADLLSEETDINISGSGNGTVNVSDFLRAEIRGSGDIIYYGEPEVNSSIRGSGNLIKR